jgi:hypothetical protein
VERSLSLNVPLTYAGNMLEMNAERSFITNPIRPTINIPAEQIFMVCHSSLLPGLRASRSNLKHDLMKDMNPKVAHPSVVLRTRMNVLYIRVYPNENKLRIKEGRLALIF